MQTKQELQELGLNESQAEVMLLMLDCISVFPDSIIENDIVIHLISDNSCELSAIMKNAVLSRVPVEDYELTLNNCELKKADNGYLLNGLNYDSDETEVISIFFTSLEIAAQSKRSRLNMTIFDDPWKTIAALADSIYDKIRLPYLTASKKEVEIEHLTRELAFLFLQSNDDLDDLPALKALLPSDLKLSKMLSSYINCTGDLQRYSKSNSICKYMSTKRFEPCWRQLLKLLLDSQEDYPEDTAELPDDVVSFHEFISEVMRKNGYEGEYPSFKKATKIKGIHLTQAKGEMFFAGMERAVVTVDCEDYISDGTGTIKIRSTTTLGGNFDNTDCYSHYFAKKGKGYCQSEYVYFDVYDNGKVEFADSAYDIPQIVCKNAVFAALSKAEKQSLGKQKTLKEALASFSFWMLCGLFFGIFMTLGFVLIELLACLFTGNMSELHELLVVTPWWMVFLGSWLGFGGLMGILSIFAK